jgi:hypothetical protein
MKQEVIEIPEWKSQSFDYAKSKGYEKLRVRYRIEYVDNAYDWKRACNDSAYNNPWEWYKVRIYDDPGMAMETYTLLYMRCDSSFSDLFGKIYDVKMWMQIYNGDEEITEYYVEPQSTYQYSMRQTMDRNMADKIDAQRRQITGLTEELERYQKFVKMVPSLWEDFKRTEVN